MSVNPFLCVCGFVGLIINANESKNVYICVIRQAFVSAGRRAVPSVNANGFAVFHQPRLDSWLTPENWGSLFMNLT